MPLTDEETQMEMCARILAFSYPDYLTWPEEKRSKAFHELLDDALSLGLNQILGTLKMLDDMVGKDAEQ